MNIYHYTLHYLLCYRYCVYSWETNLAPRDHAFKVSSNRTPGTLDKIKNQNQKILDQVWLCTCIQSFWFLNICRESCSFNLCWVSYRFLPKVLISLILTKRITAAGNKIVEKQTTLLCDRNPLISIFCLR